MKGKRSKSAGRVRGAEPKFHRLRRQLELRIRDLPPGASLPTVAAIREEYSVSQSTVDRALHELRTEGLVRSRQGSGLYVAERATLRQIGIATPYNIFNHRNSEFPRLLLCAMQRLSSDRQTLLRHYIPSGDCWKLPLQVMDLDIANRQLDGLIVLEEWREEPMDWQVPVVGLEALPSVPNRVLTDRGMLIRMGVEALVEAGCRRLALVNDDRAAAEQRRHFQEAVAVAGATTCARWQQIVDGSDPDGYVTTGAAAWHAMREADEGLPDGLVSVDDYATTGLLEVLEGADLTVASLVNRGSPVLADAPVIRLAFDPEEMARALLELLDRVIAGEVEAGECVYVQPRLVPRTT